MGKTLAPQLYKIDSALDNLWTSNKELPILKIYQAGKVKNIKETGETVNANSKLTGSIFYFLDKDEKGKLKGEPKKLLKLKENQYVETETVTPYYEAVVKNKNFWISYGGEDMVKEAEAKLANATADVKTTSSVSGNLELSNAEGLDESISNAYSNFTNESLLDGLTENTSLLSANGDEEYSYGIGDWFKRVFKRKDKKALAKISDPNVSVVSAETMKQAYKESGSKKSFKDWASSDVGQNVLTVLTALSAGLAGATLGGSKDGTGTGTGTGGAKGDEIPKTTPENTILGMKPLTFGLVAAGVLAVTTIVIIKLNKK